MKEESIKEVVRFQTPDGKIYSTRRDAERGYHLKKILEQYKHLDGVILSRHNALQGLVELVDRYPAFFRELLELNDRVSRMDDT